MINSINEYFKIKYLDLRALMIAAFEKKQLSVSSDKVAFVMLAANYNNLGDIAITKAQIDFLRRVLPDEYEIVTVPVEDTFKVFSSMKKVVNSDSIITLIGGGNTGSLYDFVEWPRRFILKHFSKDRIISFPQSVCYEENAKGRTLKKEYIKLCRKCKQLTLVAREQQSFDMYKSMFGDAVECILTPDIVFSLKYCKEHRRNGIGLVLRNDFEKADVGDVSQIVLKYGRKHSMSVTDNDTCKVHVSDNGFGDLENYLDTLSSKELIVTDRLHGMIMSFITGTPCLVFNNNNNKIGSTYETWLKEQSFIRLIKYFKEEYIENQMNVVLEKDSSGIEQAFSELANLIRRSI